MHLIWKRPDGFQQAQPHDFRVVTLSNGTALWLHKVNRDWYPFQITKDWGGEQGTKRINRLVNLLGIHRSAWKAELSLLNTEGTSLSTYIQGQIHWIQGLAQQFKGDRWEKEVVDCALNDVICYLTEAMSS